MGDENGPTDLNNRAASQAGLVAGADTRHANIELESPGEHLANALAMLGTVGYLLSLGHLEDVRDIGVAASARVEQARDQLARVILLLKQAPRTLATDEALAILAPPLSVTAR